jgi:hypothetical protein
MMDCNLTALLAKDKALELSQDKIKHNTKQEIGEVNGSFNIQQE